MHRTSTNPPILAPTAPITTMSRQSVGNPQTYEAGDQKTGKSTGEMPADLAYEEGVKNSHKATDSSTSPRRAFVCRSNCAAQRTSAPSQTASPPKKKSPRTGPTTPRPQIRGQQYVFSVRERGHR